MKSIAIPKVIGHQRVNRCKHSFWSPTEPDFQKVCTCATTMFSHIFSVFLKSGLPKSIHPFMIFHGFSVSPWFSWVFPIDVSAFMIQIPRPRSGVAWRPRACCPRLLQVPLRQMLVMFWSLAGHNDVNIILISYYTYIYLLLTVIKFYYISIILYWYLCLYLYMIKLYYTRTLIMFPKTDRINEGPFKGCMCICWPFSRFECG